MTDTLTAPPSLEDIKLTVDRCGLCRRYRDMHPHLYSSCSQVAKEQKCKPVPLFFSHLFKLHEEKHRGYYSV